MNNIFEQRVALVREKIKGLDVSKWRYEFSKEEVKPEDSFGLTTVYFYFGNLEKNFEIDLRWVFDKNGFIDGDTLGLSLSDLKKQNYMDFNIYSKKHDIKLVKLEKHTKGQDYKEFLDLYFNELVIACETYLNPFITGKEWEETPFD